MGVVDAEKGFKNLLKFCLWPCGITIDGNSSTVSPSLKTLVRNRTALLGQGLQLNF